MDLVDALKLVGILLGSVGSILAILVVGVRMIGHLSDIKIEVSSVKGELSSVRTEITGAKDTAKESQKRFREESDRHWADSEKQWSFINKHDVEISSIKTQIGRGE